MTAKLQVYKCNICGNMVEMLHSGEGELVCCGQPMVLLKENTVDASREKHVPVIEEIDDGMKVKVGAVAHPMEEKHYIEWIEVIGDNRICRKFLAPGGAPEVLFGKKVENVEARAYCNLHGLWKS